MSPTLKQIKRPLTFIFQCCVTVLHNCIFFGNSVYILAFSIVLLRFFHLMKHIFPKRALKRALLNATLYAMDHNLISNVASSNLFIKTCKSVLSRTVQREGQFYVQLCAIFILFFFYKLPSSISYHL